MLIMTNIDMAIQEADKKAEENAGIHFVVTKDHKMFVVATAQETQGIYLGWHVCYNTGRGKLMQGIQGIIDEKEPEDSDAKSLD